MKLIMKLKIWSEIEFKPKIKNYAKKFWHFFWVDESIWSWILNIIVAFVLIKFIVYPLLGLMLGTSYPIVAVVSESMEHGLHEKVICGQHFDEFKYSFDNYWNACGNWYDSVDISKNEFQQFPFKNGFEKGDVIILWRAEPTKISVGDVIVFQGNKPQPIIHRVVKLWPEDGNYYFQTKGDHNSASITGNLGETKISRERIYGKGIIRLPYLGWVKILFVDAMKPLGINIEK
jgi:signal peptidase I